MKVLNEQELTGVEVQQPHRGGWEKLRQLNLGQPEALRAAVSSPASQGNGCLQGTFVAQGASRTHSAVGYHVLSSLHGAGNAQGDMQNTK